MPRAVGGLLQCVLLLNLVCAAPPPIETTSPRSPSPSIPGGKRCCTCCRFVSKEMISECLACECGPLCKEHCLAFKCFKCDAETLSEPSCCENAGSCALAVPLAVLGCACTVWKMLGCTSGCACYCPSSAFGVGCIAPLCPGCYCIKMTAEDKKYWTGKQPFEGGTPASRAPAARRASKSKAKAAQSDVSLVTGGQSSDAAPPRRSSRAELKAEAKRKQEEEDAAKREANKSAWGAMVNQSGGANSL